MSDPDERAEDAFFVRAVWDHHLRHSGMLDRWIEIVVCRDSGPHFQNNNITLFESSIYHEYGKVFRISAFAKRHGFNECDGSLARFVKAVRDSSLGLESMDLRHAMGQRVLS